MSTAYDDLFHKYAAISGVPQPILEAVARTESSLRATIVTPEPGGHSSYGLFQILDSTARSMGYDPQTLLDAETNIKAGSEFLARLIDQQGGLANLSLNDLYSAYNSGKAKLWQTSDQVYQHVQNFLANYAIALQNTIAQPTTNALLLLVAGMLLLWRIKK